MHLIRKACGIVIIIILATIEILQSQNIGIGIANPLQMLDINGAIRIGETSVANTGAIRWNETRNDFEGYNGNAWVSLTGGKGSWGNQASYATENSASQFSLYYANTPGTEFGNAISALGNWVIAGAYRDASPGNESIWDCGSFRMMKRNGNVWTLKHSVNDPDAITNDFFGYSVGMTPSHVISGAPYANMPGISDQGKAFIYTYDSISIALQTNLLASDGQANDFFGQAVAVYGDYAIVGAPGNDILGINNIGRAYIYNRTGASWPESQILTPSDGAIDDSFGSEVALWGDYLAVSSPVKGNNGISIAGKVYVYRKNGSVWTIINQFYSPAPNYGERFGVKLSIRDNILLVGATDYLGNSADGNGSVYVYVINNNTVTYQATIQASDGEKGDKFGAAIDYFDDNIIVGAPNANVGGSSKHGKAYIFKNINGTWQQEAILSASFGEPSIHFGTSVALVPQFGVVGAPFADLYNKPNNGQLFFFKQY